ncbi:MAG: DUF86 domain-containing protein [Acidobacteriota bacterium]|nr:MAG: DUF86 domain-containing protein [Acidobacteriota bacterium]
MTALENLAAKPKEDYLLSEYDELVAERLLERVVGRMIDINFHLIVESGEPPPSNYHASFEILGKKSIVPKESAGRLAASAGLRNRIVHDYDDIDPTKVYDALQSVTKDIPEYLSHVRRYLDRLNSDT